MFDKHKDIVNLSNKILIFIAKYIKIRVQNTVTVAHMCYVCERCDAETMLAIAVWNELSIIRHNNSRYYSKLTEMITS